MSYCLPKEAESFVDTSSTLNSLKNLVGAVERGEIDLSTLSAFAKAAGSGEVPRFAQTKPVSTALLNAVRDNPDRPPIQIAYAGAQAGLWTLEDAERYVENEGALSEKRRKAKPTRGVYMTRSRIKRVRPSSDAERFAPKMNMAAITKTGVSDGAIRCLQVIMTIAGKASEITTYTTSIATTMERTPRTVRNYYVQLEEAGLITRRPGRQFNTVHITIDPLCSPSPYVEPTDVKAFKLARKSHNPGLHLMAMSVVIASVDAHPESFATSDRRKEISGFNSESNSLMSRLCDDPIGAKRGGDVAGSGKGRLAPPTTHSTLLVDPRKPLQGKSYNARSRSWQSPSGFSHVAAR